METTERRFLVIVRVANPSPANLAVLVPELQAALGRMSSAPIEQAFRSVGADIFGYFMLSKLNAHQILARIESPGTLFKHGTPILPGGDAVFVLEVGADFSSGEGFTRAGTWLQRH